jgi:hypothetical protein
MCDARCELCSNDAAPDDILCADCLFGELPCVVPDDPVYREKWRFAPT